ncbi:MAG TPA: hypothetical protein VGH76_00780 [Actinomycetospora sp.]|jgi:hypothetical protein|uniref:hypothetical protein n=1 Tax=Actinomycetospora sp. TaxID=1872135 RepID=UPI002F409E34
MAVLDPLRHTAADLLDLTGDAVAALTITAAGAVTRAVGPGPGPRLRLVDDARPPTRSPRGGSPSPYRGQARR